MHSSDSLNAEGTEGQILGESWGKNRRLQAIYITGYLALVMFSISGLLLQGGVATLAGIIAFTSVCVVLAACLYRNKFKRNYVSIIEG